MTIHILTTLLKSKSAREVAKGLSTRLGYKVWRGSTMKPKRTHLVYGDQKGKIEQYEYFQANAINALEFTTSREQAQAWAGTCPIVCRKLTHASEGKGIVVAETAAEVVAAPVYTKYKKKKREFRVHIFKDKVVHVLEKRKKNGVENGETKIRNTINGYVFCSENVVEPQGIRELALKASKVTKSDFKGIDIGYNEAKKELFVIECNSAPGIEGTNVKRYVDVIVASLQAGNA